MLDDGAVLLNLARTFINARSLAFYQFEWFIRTSPFNNGDHSNTTSTVAKKCDRQLIFE